MSKQKTEPSWGRRSPMTYRTTIGWSLVTSGVVTLLLAALPGGSLWWGLLLLVLGIAVLLVRR